MVKICNNKYCNLYLFYLYCNKFYNTIKHLSTAILHNFFEAKNINNPKH